MSMETQHAAVLVFHAPTRVANPWNKPVHCPVLPYIAGHPATTWLPRVFSLQ